MSFMFLPLSLKVYKLINKMMIIPKKINKNIEPTISIMVILFSP